MVDKITDLQARPLTDIQRFIVLNVEYHPADIARLAGEKFGISRQAVHKHVQSLMERGLLDAQGQTRARHYSLPELISYVEHFPLAGVSEDQIWSEKIAPLVKDLPENIRKICHHGFTEILNNAIDHSEGHSCRVITLVNAKRVWIFIEDDGIGIFRKIKRELNLDDEHQAILDLHKGKLTTAPSHHSGEGIFFTSRVFSEFNISSYGLTFHAGLDKNHWLIDDDTNLKSIQGTGVSMHMHLDSGQTLQAVFDSYTSTGDDWGFTKTHISIRLALYQGDGLVSRSQAKRILSRTDRFRDVMLDFSGVDSIGQAFADEIFRVFTNQNPQINLLPFNMNDAVEKMIKHVTHKN